MKTRLGDRVAEAVKFYYRSEETEKTVFTEPDLIAYSPSRNTYIAKNFTQRVRYEPGQEETTPIQTY